MDFDIEKLETVKVTVNPIDMANSLEYAATFLDPLSSRIEGCSNEITIFFDLFLKQMTITAGNENLCCGFSMRVPSLDMTDIITIDPITHYRTIDERGQMAINKESALELAEHLRQWTQWSVDSEQQSSKSGHNHISLKITCKWNNKADFIPGTFQVKSSNDDFMYGILGSSNEKNYIQIADHWVRDNEPMHRNTLINSTDQHNLSELRKIIHQWHNNKEITGNVPKTSYLSDSIMFKRIGTIRQSILYKLDACRNTCIGAAKWLFKHQEKYMIKRSSPKHSLTALCY